jgi:uncharacterized protein YqeY
MISEDDDAAEDMRDELQADLRTAMKGRALVDVSVLRALIAALDNAGAVPPPPRSEPGPAEVARRRLSVGDVQAVLRREYEAREAAVGEFDRLGLSVESERASREMAVVSKYLTSPTRP